MWQVNKKRKNGLLQTKMYFLRQLAGRLKLEKVMERRNEVPCAKDRTLVWYRYGIVWVQQQDRRQLKIIVHWIPSSLWQEGEEMVKRHLKKWSDQCHVTKRPMGGWLEAEGECKYSLMIYLIF